MKRAFDVATEKCGYHECTGHAHGLDVRCAKRQSLEDLTGSGKPSADGQIHHGLACRSSQSRIVVCLGMQQKRRHPPRIKNIVGTHPGASARTVDGKHLEIKLGCSANGQRQIGHAEGTGFQSQT